MALFDFPRIHFSGNIDLNVPTINNSYYFPISIYDQVGSDSFQPPRLYFSNQTIPNNVKPGIPGLTATPDPLNGYWYIVIEPINSLELLRTWCMTPLGTDPNAPDAAYFPYYVAANGDLAVEQGAPIVGNCPGYWNMYGDMGVSMNNVKVTGIQMFDGKAVETITAPDPNLPPIINELLNASFDLDSAPGNGITTACMVETISSQSVYASIFCNQSNLYNSSTGKIFFKGGKCRFGAMLYGTWRVLNWMPAMSGSARFSAGVPLKDIPESEAAGLVEFFNANKTTKANTALKGFFISFTVLEIFENRYDQSYYANNNTTPNPAQATTVGTITPWYEGDMQTCVPGRNLVALQSLGTAPIYTNTNSIVNPFNPQPPAATVPINMTPAVCALQDLGNGTAIFSVDMGNSWPEMMTPQFSPLPPYVLPAKRGDASFETATLGTLNFSYSPDVATSFATINIDPVSNPRANVFQTGCIFDFVLTDPTLIQSIQNNFITVLLYNGSQYITALKESTYMICTDQKGLYAEEGDTVSMGFQVNSNQREPCVIRIFQRGMPVTTPIAITMAEYVVPEAANDPGGNPTNLFPMNLADNSVVNFSDQPLTMSNNAVYYFVYDSQYPGNTIPPFANPGYTVMDTGSFVCLRVRPSGNYKKYIDTSDPDYAVPTFDIIYREIFQMYDIAYPAMSLVHKFDPDVWDNAIMAGMVLQRTDPALWNDTRYMPRSRELSRSQRVLLEMWAAYIKTHANATNK